MLTSPISISFTFLLSLPIVFFFAPHMLPSTNLYFLHSDEIDDLALFNIAIKLSSKTPSTPSHIHLGTFNPIPKIAFLFLTNSNLTFSPLWEKFFHGNQNLFNIYIHSDPTVPINPPGGVFTNRFIKAKRTERSSPSLIAAERRLLAHALIEDPLNQYFAVVSQYCIPLHSFDYVYRSLFKTPLTSLSTESNYDFKFKSFIEILDDEPSLWDRYNSRGMDVMLPEIQFRDFRIGSQFFLLTREHALLVVKDIKLWKKFKLPCLDIFTCYPEENYFSTLLNTEDPDGCTGFTLTRVNWTDCHDGHPHLYTPGEVSPKLIRQLRRSDSGYSYFFARKFSPESLPMLMEIADEVILPD